MRCNMRTIEALKILELNPDFDFDSLRRSYYKKIKENHPDLFENLSNDVVRQQNEISQQLNEAYETLVNYLKKINNQDSDALELKKRSYIDLIRQYTVSGLINNSNSSGFVQDIKALYTNYKNKIRACGSTSEVTECLNSFKSDLSNLYLRAIEKYRKVYCMYEADSFNYNFNLDCSAEEFIKQLKDYNSKYREFIFEKRLRLINGVIKKYEGHLGYSQMQDKIARIREQAIFRLDDISFDFSTILEDVNLSMQHIMDTYSSNYSRYNDLVLKYDSLGLMDPNLSDSLEALKSYMTNFDKFDAQYEKIMPILNEKSKKDNIDKLYYKLLSKYVSSLLLLAPSKSQDKIHSLNNSWQRVCEILKSVMNFSSPDLILDSLSLITFDSDSDDEILAKCEEMSRREKLSATQFEARIRSIIGELNRCTGETDQPKKHK